MCVCVCVCVFVCFVSGPVLFARLLPILSFFGFGFGFGFSFVSFAAR